MKITPSGSTPPPFTADTGAQSQSQQAKRAEVVAKLDAMVNQSRTQENPLHGSGNLAPEDFSAVQARSQAAQEEQELDPSESATEEIKEEPKKEDPYSAKLAQLARRERAIRAEQVKRDTAFRAKEADLLRREEALTGRDKQYETDYIPKSRLQQSTFEALAEAGIDPTRLEQQFRQLGENPVDPRINIELQQLRATIQKLEAANENSAKAQAQAQDDQYKAAVRQISNDVTSLVKSDPNFEAIRETKSQRDVVELIERTFKEEGRVMSVEEAAQEVEDYLTEQMSNYAQKIKKIRARLQPSTPVKPEARPVEAQNKQLQMKTLTNTNSSTRRLSARERAIAVFKGEKNG